MGHKEEALKFFAKAKDSVVGIPVPAAPRPPSSVQNEMLKATSELGLLRVSQPELFSTEGRTPDNSMFVDYCHLSLEAIEITIREVSKNILDSFGLSYDKNIEVPSSTLSPKQKSLVHILAAVHNAHYGQPYEQILFHARKAIQSDSSSVHEISLFLDFMNRSSARWLCQSFLELCRYPFIKRYLHPRDPNEWDKFEDSQLTKAFIEVTKSALPDLERKINDLLISEHRNGVSCLDLLNFQFRAKTFRSRYGHSLGDHTMFYRSTNKNSEFQIVAKSKDIAKLFLSIRIPNNLNEKYVDIYLNNVRLETFLIGEKWSQRMITISQGLRDGRNNLSVVWPNDSTEWKDHGSDLEYQVNSGSIPCSLPIFGEISNLKVFFVEEE